MTISNFKSTVAAYINRTVASLTSVNSQDLLLHAMNDARRGAQRDHNFEINRTEDAYLSTHLGGANWMTGCKTTPGGATAVLMKRVDEVWNYGSLVIGATTYYPRTSRIDYDSTGRFKRELPSVSGLRETDPQSFSVQNRFAYTNGSLLHVTTVQTATIYKLVGIKWLDDLAGSEDTDPFVTYFTDWFKFATIAALNIYLKDAERFPIDMVAMSRMWESVKHMDGTIANMGESSNLD